MATLQARIEAAIRDYETNVEPLLMREGKSPAAERASHALVTRHGTQLVEAALDVLALRIELSKTPR